jgi:putative ABC transport system permease protein
VGLLPAFQASRTDVQDVLRSGGRALAGAAGHRMRALLVIGETALSVMLLVGAGLLVRSFVHLQRVDTGIDTSNVLTTRLALTGPRYPTTTAVQRFFDEVSDRLKQAPGILQVAATSALPLAGGGFYLGRVFLKEGQAEPPAAPDYPAQWNVITPEYFTTMRIPVLGGRAFLRSDTATSTPVVVINRALAEQMFPAGDALGARIRSWRDENVLREIVGIVGDVKYFGPADGERPLVYVPHAQDPWNAMTLAIRTTGDPRARIDVVRRAIGALDLDLALAEVQTMDEVAAQVTAAERFGAMVMLVFAGAAALLAAVGLYGVLSYLVVIRRREIGIRMALGAATGDVVRLIARHALLLTAIGLAIGLAGSVAVTRVLRGLLFEVTPTDPATFIAMSALFAAIAVTASAVPARRAAAVDPAQPLRSE